MADCAVLLHGFAGTGRSWEGVIARLDHERYLPLAPDLPGHGEHAQSECPITFAGCVEHILSLAPERFVLCGYSLGGRIALHVALTAPERVSRLVLVSCSPGIEDPAQRALRRESDHRLADDLEERPFRDFIERWAAQPLFAADPQHVVEIVRAEQARNSPTALAAALRGIGSGEMEPLWSRLGELGMPASLLAGERDPGYAAIARRMAELIPRAKLRLVDGGHRLPLENPGAVAQAIG